MTVLFSFYVLKKGREHFFQNPGMENNNGTLFLDMCYIGFKWNKKC